MIVADLIAKLKEKPPDSLVMLRANDSNSDFQYQVVTGLGTWSSKTSDIVFVLADGAHITGKLLEAGWRPKNG